MSDFVRQFGDASFKIISDQLQIMRELLGLLGVLLCLLLRGQKLGRLFSELLFEPNALRHLLLEVGAKRVHLSGKALSFAAYHCQLISEPLNFRSLMFELLFKLHTPGYFLLKLFVGCFNLCVPLFEPSFDPLSLGDMLHDSTSMNLLFLATPPQASV
jgi:hypothetical protein